ncbi:ribosomal RNA small subunit methyltransferase G [Roseovarius sp. A-2]|uniref:16S rRNA (guanine(527)-N(7))-methyltransferase RsmG n=1 Tax=Roseovarius sp. A-2 TaxID=1570360 RepID=UPI0009B4FAA0|nr:16S rRNA (guanine(527)-N(7))-methyltransferase RsmG [Roseovarius sp. A-2]GAW36338.1 ribosomal RNA small subunit methyltransferase G [Roseovarius sp. A-2]
MTPDLRVSRETQERLEIYATLLRKWNPRINLVSRSSLNQLWTRHILDSAQLLDLAEENVTSWVDLGSGGGFPGLVVAIIGTERRAPLKCTLIESDARKSAFLRTIIRETGVNATVITDRIEAVPPQGADVVSARALADLSTLIGFADRHLSSTGKALFPKGENWREEVEVAQSKWQFDYRIAKSKTEPGPVILSVTGVVRA